MRVQKDLKQRRYAPVSTKRDILKLDIFKLLLGQLKRQSLCQNKVAIKLIYALIFSSGS